MFIERLVVTNFRCFGPTPHTIALSSGLTAFVGSNGTGKTAVMQALQRLFGVTPEQRLVRRQDFHIPPEEPDEVLVRTFSIEAILAFPELDVPDGDHSVVPEFFQQMAADEHGHLKCRIRLEATWTDDGSLDGAVEPKMLVVRTFGTFDPANDCIELRAIDRARIQLIYVPAARDGASQITGFLRGRLWRAINWSQAVRDVFESAGAELNSVFSTERAVDVVTTSVCSRWQQIHSGGTDATPRMRPVDPRFQEFIRKVEVVFHPDEAGRERGLEELSDGQRSLFHLAMTAATLDVEARIAADRTGTGFKAEGIPFPALTVLAIEEPENNLAPFFLSRIVHQLQDLTLGPRAQALLSSHSASILARVDPSGVRHFRINPPDRSARVSAIRLPENDEEASKFVREAVQIYPELYFARFVILGEGASEEIVLPRLATALGFPIDRSFVAVVPLGGRHVNHLWRLLKNLEIPHATLLDLDLGRPGGGWGRIKTVCAQLLENGVAPQALFGSSLDPAGPAKNLAAFDSYAPDNRQGLAQWLSRLRTFRVFFCEPLDLDYSMLRAFPAAYQTAESGRTGPSPRGDPRTAVLGEEGIGSLYPPSEDVSLRWYRYLFLGRGKPSTHVRVLNALSLVALAQGAPGELSALLALVIGELQRSQGAT